MRVMVLVKATKDSEARQCRTQEPCRIALVG
jgi:hypothetical protein